MLNTVEIKLTKVLKILFALSLLYALFSYSLTDPNLVITSWQPYWRFQQWMWVHFFQNAQLLTITYGLLITSFFGVYFTGLRLLKQSTQPIQPQQLKKLFIAILLAISPLFLSYNALSHDIFNYMFNAKMVLIYQANPHVTVALDYASDNWTRFMHNTHTPAPYGYGWTALSLIPYALGFSKFLSTWLLFRAFALLSIGLLFLVLQKLSQVMLKKDLSPFAYWLVFLNPLLLIEVISNQHNDLWMMVPALASMLLILEKPKKQLWGKLLLSAVLLAFSASIKFATLVLAPIWVIGVLRLLWPTWRQKVSWPTLALFSSILLFLPLLTARSQQFLPWYLLWSLVWLPLIKPRLWRAWLVAFSVSALVRYIPWLLAGGFTDQVLAQQKWLVWGGGLGLWLVWLGWSSLARVRYNKR